MQTRHYFLMNNLVWNFCYQEEEEFLYEKRAKSSDIDVFLVRLNLKTIFTTKKESFLCFSLNSNDRLLISPSIYAPSLNAFPLQVLLERTNDFQKHKSQF